MVEDIIKIQNTIGQDVAALYNTMVASSHEDRNSFIVEWKEKLEALEGLFEANDVELQENADLIKKSDYVKNNYALKVRNHVKSGKILLEKFYIYISKPSKTPQPVQDKPTSGVLARRFKFALRGLEDSLQYFKTGTDTATSLRRAKDNAWAIGEEYYAEFGEDELMAHCFSLLKQFEKSLGGASKEKASIESLPFSIPTIELPEFKGDYTKWGSFKELFLELIDRKQISKTQKMVVLKSVIKGDAAITIANLPLTEANYDTAWKLLNEKYTNERAITSIFFKNIVDAPFVNSTVESVKHFKDKVQESLHALQATNLSIEDLLQSLISFLLVRKMDDSLRMKFENSLKSSKELPKVDSLLSFLEHEFYVLEAYQGSSNDVRNFDKSMGKTSDSTKCIMGCNSTHSTAQCLMFKKLSIKDRWSKVVARKLCSKCLTRGHSNKFCFESNCKTCEGNHNTLLHKETGSSEAKSVIANYAITDQNQVKEKCVLLSTAIIEVADADGNWINCRALLDNGSQVCFIKKSFQKKLKLKSFPASASIEGITKNVSVIKERLNVCIQSKQSDYKTNLDVLVVPQIVSNLPACKVVPEELPSRIKLADPNYFIPGSIDMLIGAELFYEILFSENLRLDKNKVLLQDTALGWIVSGPALIDKQVLHCKVASYVETSLNQRMESFCVTEEMVKECELTKEEIQCETFFEKTLSRTHDGKLVFHLPFKIKEPKLGNSGIIAKRRFLSIERKLEKNLDIKFQYHSFSREYLELGHMELVNFSPGEGYFLPHHYVLKPESTSTKLRVGFDASCKSNSNISLNDLLHTGPRLQDNLFEILLRFRKHKYVISGDIEKMFSQILIHDNHCKYQMIFWRWNPSQPLQTHKLETITYGTNCAPYLATKCLQMAAKSVKIKYPKVAAIISSEFYMDDFLTGSDLLDDLKTIQLQVYSVLNDHGFYLRKWNANHSDLLKQFPEKDLQISVDLNKDNSDDVKALGMVWNPSSDDIFIKSNWDSRYKISKRNILSNITKLFNPLILLAPVTVVAKILLQEFRNRWSLKYLSELQKRYKLVLLKDNNAPPMSWRRGRVEKTSLGKDGLCRIVDIRTNNGISKRSMHNVCPFPIKEGSDNYINNLDTKIQSKIPNYLKDVNSASNSKNKKKLKIKNKNCILIILSLLLVLHQTIAFDVKTLVDRSGIFFEEQGIVKLQKSSWSLVAFINLTTYISRYDDVSKAVTQVRWICAKQDLSQESGSQNIQEQLRRKMNIITENNKFIIGDRKGRHKRAPLSFIGAIQHALFGVMDEEHAEMLEDKVKKRSQSEAYYFQLLKNMSSIQDVTSNVIKRQHGYLQDQFVKIQQNFEIVMEKANRSESIQQLNLAAFYAFLIMDEFEHFQEDIKQAMLKMKGGTQQHIITPEQLQEHLEKIKLQLPYDLKLPAEAVGDLFNIFETTATSTREFILFEMKIPLVHREGFTIFEVHPYPTRHESRFVSIQTNFNHLLLGESKKRYYNLKDIDFLQCKNMNGNGIWICPQTQPIYNVGNRNPCEVDLLLKKTVLPGTCLVKIQQPSSIWIQLNAPNTWLYSVMTEETIDIECQHLRTPQTIKDQGIIRLDSGCHLYSPDVTLIAFTKVQQNITYFNPAVNISLQLPTLSLKVLKDVSTTIAIEDIPKTQTQFFGLPVDLDLDVHDATHYGISIVTWIMLIILLIMVAKLIQKFCQLPTRFLPASIALAPIN